MDSKHTSHPGRSVLGRARLYCLLLMLPSVLFAVLYLYEKKFPLVVSVLLGILIVLYLLLISSALMESLIRPLQTLSNVVASLREGDTSFRARITGSSDALGELAGEINTLADLMQKHRIRSLEATALLDRILEVMHTPLFAFDREQKLRLMNDAAVQLLGCSQSACLGLRAGELRLQTLLEAPDQSIHALGTQSTRWLLRRAVFRQDGEPNTLLLLADVSVPLQEEEQTAWKRLIRVLGHELSNSLAPIKSIAGTLISQVEDLQPSEKVRSNFERGLSVIESRADALHRFVQSYRRLAQLPPPQCVKTEIRPLLERVASLEQRVNVQLESGPSVHVFADSDQLEQMLINLLANAADASLESNTDAVSIRWESRESEVRIFIVDRGPGIANSENLFVPFYTTRVHGSGVGLALAQQIAQAHGGSVTLKNREDGAGSRATVHLPIRNIKSIPA